MAATGSYCNHTYINITDPPTTGKQLSTAYAQVIILIILSIGCLLGNGLVITVIITQKQLRRPSNLFIGGLAITDMGFTFCHAVAIDSGIHGRWRFSRQLCVVNSLFMSSAAILSLAHMATISLNRYMYLCHQTTFPMAFTWKASWVQEVATWVIAIVVGVLPGYFMAHAHYDERLRTCTFSSRCPGEWKYPLYLTITMVMMPSVINIICYGKIYKKVYNVRIRLAKHMTMHEAPWTGGRRLVDPNTIAKHQMQHLKSRFIVFLIFVIMIFPFALLTVLDSFTDFPPELHMAMALLLCANSMVNPIIYGLCNKSFREAYKGTLHRFRLCFRKRLVGPAQPRSPVINHRSINAEEGQEKIDDNRDINLGKEVGNYVAARTKADDKYCYKVY